MIELAERSIEPSALRVIVLPLVNSPTVRAPPLEIRTDPSAAEIVEPGSTIKSFLTRIVTSP